MPDETPRDSSPCPRCGAATQPGANYCANCGLSLSGLSSRNRTRPDNFPEFVVWLGPAIGGILAWLIAEAVFGQLSEDSSLLLPIAVIVGIGTIVGGPILAWLFDRLRPSR